MIIVPFEPEHAQRIELPQAHAHWLSHVSADYRERLPQLGPAYTAMVGERVIGCAGIIETGAGSGYLWALASRDSRPHFVGLIRAVRRLMELSPLRRLEATVERGFNPGCRALELLGFSCEGLMKKYGPDGKDHFRYA